ncbi:hypothetical protein METBIDRAFT_37187 [Metschnikowia bicuspidata var. bicuspidata NRRL YB-4993]|uniref:Flavin reductase like domain-containing protein n=1 Tax=Metschnikowia bicuspidata var. bicuspidata NRRL YB-4993 TaxID=869754 RepID=A0A1A0HIG8_9ASCO|nr:hypothetical protein METBIDRAFT_37187 [Metschnikowia bicuspidata var. bicuspidata NRRL YB-4993]OBA23964.1 hypothetical protein METBIDRAFT_37187 [Metschnikowia bicuspidata var. bicuspidata NRRL YB-4993]
MILSSRLFQNVRGTDIGSIFKSAMARVSSQTMILTAGTGAISSELHGMTLSSVCSLSVHPTPLLLFNLHLPSYTSKTLHECDGILGLHVMPPTKKAVMLGRKFAGGVKRDTSHFDAESEDGEPFHEMTTPFKGLSDAYSMHMTSKGIYVPILKELEVVFLCAKHRVFTVDKHELWVVRVDDILFPNKNYDSKSSGGLLYFQRGFRQLGQLLSE